MYNKYFYFVIMRLTYGISTYNYKFNGVLCDFNSLIKAQRGNPKIPSLLQLLTN